MSKINLEQLMASSRSGELNPETPPSYPTPGQEGAAEQLTPEDRAAVDRIKDQIDLKTLQTSTSTRDKLKKNSPLSGSILHDQNENLRPARYLGPVGTIHGFNISNWKSEVF